MNLRDLFNGLQLSVQLSQIGHQIENPQTLAIFKSFVDLFTDLSLDPVGEMTDALMKTPAYNLAAQSLKQNPDCAAMIESRYMAKPHNLEELLCYPKDSFGYIYASYLIEKGYDPDLYSDIVINSDGSYVEARISQTHDIWHIITGFDTSIIGEIGLQAFHLPQFPYPLATMLIANSLMFATLAAPETLPNLLDAIAQGWEMGKKAKPLFAQKWEQAWDKPLIQWQRELNIEPIMYQHSPIEKVLQLQS
ncbi:conserved hypothetical protein [Gloeothece citriformis PCC 7424]|uniref:Ubiquinone biosynthesis protein n=1 Tax=Gloeothece citriformis (strain PCC 7424) TaxID=65393 RepID=B7KD57_GLOC7|nr:Coq4 family protein [Gloeothece citriformis]ACK73178.1 conserved hypothetical protein [Gloeothece citriformis PCC 7424]